LRRQVTAGFRRVGAIVDAGTQDFRRIRNHRQKAEIGQLLIGPRALSDFADFIERAGRDRIGQRLVAPLSLPPKVTTPSPLTTPEGCSTVGQITCQFHFSLVP
jgi:hypothetical protein